MSCKTSRGWFGLHSGTHRHDHERENASGHRKDRATFMALPDYTLPQGGELHQD